jgi:DNA-binding NtrC family response regulator
LPKHILIVDDDAGVRTVLGDMLQDAGYLVSLVTDGAEMRAFLAKDKSVDTVVLDFLMPGEHGVGLALHAKSLNLPVIMTSGSLEGMQEAARSGLQLLNKPFHYSELVAAVEKALAIGKYGQRCD